MYVDRIYDKKRNVLVYVSYTEKLSGDNANNSISIEQLREIFLFIVFLSI